MSLLVLRVLAFVFRVGTKIFYNAEKFTKNVFYYLIHTIFYNLISTQVNFFIRHQPKNSNIKFEANFLLYDSISLQC